MGLTFDSSILIAGERGGESVRAILKRVQATQGETESGLSAVTVVELTHGIYRAKTDTHRERRRAFTEELCRDLTVHPVTLEIAQLAGKIEGEQAARGHKHCLRRSAPLLLTTNTKVRIWPRSTPVDEWLELLN
jgi:tRNA(fMet)-specific endonuclease VapC